MWVTVTYFHLETELLTMMHPYVKFDDHTTSMYSALDMNSDVN